MRGHVNTQTFQDGIPSFGCDHSGWRVWSAAGEEAERSKGKDEQMKRYGIKMLQNSQTIR